MIPRHARHAADPEGPAGRRLRPIFRDDDEMAPSGPLAERLRTAIDEAPAMILLASPASARSHYVNLEVEHFLSGHDPKRLVIIVTGADRPAKPELPPALDRVEDPLWLDARGARKLTRRNLVRVAAVVLDVGFEALWRRHVRYRRQLTALWCALALVVGTVVGMAIVRQLDAEKRSPEQQRAQFVEWMTNNTNAVGLPVDEVKLNITRVDDLDNDGLMEFFVVNETEGYCGSGGCVALVYRTVSPGDYEVVLELLGASTSRVRQAADGSKEVIFSDLSVSREPLYSVYTLRGGKFQLKHHEFCDGLNFEVCTQPMVITPIPWERAPSVEKGTPPLERPSADARVVRIGAGGSTFEGGDYDLEAKGMAQGGEWYLVEVWKGSCGFVPASAVGPHK
ncbi:toll/interleukin-1 receptor domain-containing protein [Lentzea fradiae]|uniref:toll/interleukin-1 receptor domain-containing protein n=1 Tax=Lentzea fradiae TaxID=200378 RepID=UPI003CCBB6CE